MNISLRQTYKAITLFKDDYYMIIISKSNYTKEIKQQSSDNTT